MTEDKTGRIVWHDLFTADRQGALCCLQNAACIEASSERAP